MALLRRKKHSKTSRTIQVREMTIHETSEDKDFQQIKNPSDVSKMLEKHGKSIGALTDQSTGEKTGWFGRSKVKA